MSLYYSPEVSRINSRNDPQGVANFDPRGKVYIRDHQTLLHAKYISCGLHGFREEDFLKFFPL